MIDEDTGEPIALEGTQGAPQFEIVPADKLISKVWYLHMGTNSFDSHLLQGDLDLELENEGPSTSGIVEQKPALRSPVKAIAQGGVLF